MSRKPSFIIIKSVPITRDPGMLLVIALITMDTCKALDNYGHTPQVPWLQSSMLPTASLAIVGIPDNHPGYIVGL